MKRFSEFIVKNRLVVTIVAAVILIASVVGSYFVISGGKINSDLLVYLPKNTPTYDGIKFLKETFDIEGDAFVVVEGEENDALLAASVAKMQREIGGITQFVWYGDVKNIEKYAKKLNLSDKIEVEELKSYLRRPILDENGETIGYNYVLLILFSYSPSTKEAFAVHDKIREELGENLGRSVAISGMTALAQTVMSETLKEVPYYIIFSFLAALIILLLSTKSFLEPFVLLFTMGVAIVVNIGSNIILKDVSILSFAASSVLQLGITMDYAVFMLHAYREERDRNDPLQAAKNAIPRGAINVLAGGLTTIGGFAALYFMRFTIGADLANVVIKGVVMSILTVIFVQPCLMIFMDKPIRKTSHKTLYINVEPVTKKVLKARYAIAIVSVALVIPAFFGQNSVDFSYLKIYEPPAERTAQELLAESLQNQMIIAVPYDVKTGSHKEFIEELVKDEKIDSAIGAFTAINISESEFKELISNDAVAEIPTVKMLFRKVQENGKEKIYTLYLVEIAGDTEDEAAFKTEKYLTDTLDKYFDVSYPFGILTGVVDMADITPGDFLRVSLISVGIILVIMCLLLKSVRKSVLMVVLIELAVWMNISLNTIFGAKINFMIYIIISSVQLGCTVDYAILMSTRFEEAKLEYKDAQTAAIKAVSSTFPAISVSASIIISVCMVVYFISNNLLVKEITGLMARGAAISYVLVMLVLPCLLVFFKRIKPVDFKFGRRKNKAEFAEGNGDATNNDGGVE